MELRTDRAFGRFDVNEIAKTFPPTADTLLLDTYLTNEEAASARIFRVYKETPPHYHATCDEYLYVLSGRGTFWMGSPENTGEFAPGNLLFFKRGTVHALPTILAACRSDVSDCRPFASITEIWSVCALSDGKSGRLAS